MAIDRILGKINDHGKVDVLRLRYYQNVVEVVVITAVDDLNEAVVWEMKGTLTPGRVARVVLQRFDDRAWQATTSQRLREMYANHAGAADRMAAAILEGAA